MATATKTWPENTSSRYLYYFAIIPILSTCTMWPNHPVTEKLGTAFKLGQRMKKITVMCSRSPQNLEFGHFTLLFGLGLQRNVPKFMTHMQGLCFSH